MAKDLKMCPQGRPRKLLLWYPPTGFEPSAFELPVHCKRHNIKIKLLSTL